MSEVKLRLRWNGGNCIIGVNSNSCFRVLQDQIFEKTGISVPFQDLRKGFPPKGFSYKGSVFLEETELRNGETLVIERRSTPLDLNEFSDSLIMFRRIINSDNSCLFNAIAYATEGRSKNLGSFLRNIVSPIIQDDPETYNLSLLGKPNEEYCLWIEQPTSWGGGIELSIISKYYGINIGAVSIKDGIIHVFGQEFSYPKIIYVIYDGIHYDVLVKNLSESQTEATDLTEFQVDDMQTYQQAIELSKELKGKREFTDTGNFKLKCNVCYVGLVGEKEAVEHASATGHTNFAEF